MNNKIIRIFIVTALALVSIVSFDTIKGNAEDAPLRKQHLSWQENPWPTFSEVLENYGIAKGNEGTILDVPIYVEADLMFDKNCMFELGKDAGVYHGFSILHNSGGPILAAYPTTAIRVRDDGMAYTMHDTDSGYRLYLFFDKSDDYIATIAFPIVIKEVMAFSDFANLKIGDPMELVEEIDSVATIHKRYFYDVWGIDYVGAKNMAKAGYPCTTIHYLKDGILRIEYEMIEDGTLIISNIELNEEHVLTDILGNKIDCKISEMDLPKR